MAGVLGINLLPGIKPTLEEKRVSKKIRTWGTVILAGYVIFVAGIFIIGATLSLQRSQVKGKVTALEQQIKSEQKKESLELALKGRIGEVGKIIKGRVSYASLITKILSLAPTGVSFQELDFSQSKISLSGEATNALVMTDFLEKLKKETDFSWVYLNSLSRTKTGGYSFSLEIAF